MSKPYNLLFKPGNRLILELKSRDIFEGIYADGGVNRIVLTEVIQHNNDNKLGDLYEFYRNEIEKIHTLKLPTPKSSETEPDKTSTNSVNNPKECKIIKVSEHDYFRLKEMSQNFIYIENCDKRYFDAMKILQDAETIGVVSLGLEKQRCGSTIKLLVLCTWKKVYIFDLINLKDKEMLPEIKEIFESEFICKVIHKSPHLVDVLYRHYEIYMRNIFDTQIVDCILQKKEGFYNLKDRNLSECLVYHMNFPASLLEQVLEIPNKVWCERPVSDNNRLYAAQLATYLIVLKEYFQQLLLKDVYDATYKIQDFVYDMDDFELMSYLKKPEIPQSINKLLPDLKKLSVSKQ